GTLDDVPDVPPGADAVIRLPGVEEGDGETFVTVQAVLAEDLPWAKAGHEIAWTQLPMSSRRRPSVTPGTAEFADDGRLVKLGPFDVVGPVLQVWRAPTDNDRAAHGDAIE